MNNTKSLLSALLVLYAARGMSASVYLETFTPENASHASSGEVLFNDAFIGIRFDVAAPLHLVGAVGNFWGRGTFFAAITSLDRLRGFPSPRPGFTPNDVLTYSEREVNTRFGNPTLPSEDNVFALNVTLVPGDYVVFFGAANASSTGYMPPSPDLSKSSIALSDYLEYSRFPLNPNRCSHEPLE